LEFIKSNEGQHPVFDEGDIRKGWGSCRGHGMMIPLDTTLTLLDFNNNLLICTPVFNGKMQGWWQSSAKSAPKRLKLGAYLPVQ
jgi:hypothetical protein